MKLVIGMIALLVGPLSAIAQESTLVERRLVEVLPTGWIHDAVVVTPDGAQLYFQSLFNRPGTYPLELTEENHNHTAVWTITQSYPAQPKHPHAIHQAFVSPIGARWQIIVDGQKGKGYLKILDGSLTLSPNNARLAYVALDEDGWHAIVSGIPGPAAEKVSAPIFSQDSRHITYIASTKRKCWINRDGKPGMAFSDIIEASLTFSSSSDHLAYVARDEDKYVMVLDGRLGPRYDLIGPPVFSPDGAHLAYAARQGKRWLVVNDGKPGPLLDYAWGPVFSTDGLRLAYIARTGRKASVMVNGKPGKQYDDVWNYQFSPNGKRLAYIARNDKRFFAVIDGAEGKSYSRIPTARPCLRFSPDSTRVAYVAHNAGADFIVVNGIESERYDFIEGPIFSPDSRRLAYMVSEDGKAFTVIDGHPEPTFQAVGTPVFSPDGRKIAYTAKLAGQWSMAGVANEGQAYNFILNPTTDAAIELATGAQDQLTFRVDVPVNPQWAIFQYAVPSQIPAERQGGISWAQNGNRTVLRYLAVKNGTIYWVEKTV